MTTSNQKLIWIGIGVVAIIFFVVLITKPSPNSDETMTESSQQTGSSIGFAPASLKLGSGKTASVDITMDPSQLPSAAVTISLSFDPSKVKVTSLKNGTVFPNILSAAKISSGKATLSIATPPDSTGVTTAGVIATLQIESLSNSASVISFGSETMAVALTQEGNILKNIGTLKVN